MAPPTPLAERPRPQATFELHPALGISEEYSDNFNQSQQPRENFRTSISPALTLRAAGAPIQAHVEYQLRVVHDTLTDDQGLFNSFVGQFAWEATPRLNLTLSDVFTQSDEPERADRLDLRRGRREFTSNALSAGASYALGNLGTHATYRLATFSEEGGSETISHTAGGGVVVPVFRLNTFRAGYDYLSSETSGARAVGDSTITGHEVTGSFARELTERTTVGMTAAYALRTQDQPSPARDIEFNRWSASLYNAYTLPGRIQLNGSLGASRLQSDTTGGRTLLSTATSLRYWLGRAVADLNVDRGHSETFGAGENFGVIETTGVTAALSYEFTTRLTGLATGAYRENDFTGLGGGQADRSEKTWRGSIAFSVQLLRWLNSSLEYTHTQTRSTGLGQSFDENRVRLTLNATF